MTRIEKGSDDQLPKGAWQHIADLLAAFQRRLDDEQRRVEAQPRVRPPRP
jgi:hypothetical protein